MKHLIIIFAIMLGFVSCNSDSKAEVDSTEVVTDTVEFINSPVEVDSIVEMPDSI